MTQFQKRLTLILLWILATSFALLSLLFLIMAHQLSNLNSVFSITLFLLCAGFLHQLLVKVIPGARRLFS